MPLQLVKPLSEMTLEELWLLFPIQLSEYNPAWSAWYEEERSKLVSLLCLKLARIDHIGSTYVTGLAAKPIVDILLQVKQDTDMAAVKNALVADGWLVMAEDLVNGEIDLNKGYTPAGFAEKVYHLHVRREGDWDEIYFRNYLASHPKAIKEYELLKQKLLVQYKHNRDAYTEGKTEFIKALTARARSESQHS